MLLSARGAAGVDDASQAEMFETDAAMPSMVPAPTATRTGPGRPAGARNKSTEAWRELYLSKFRHPLMVLGDLTSRTPEQLARDLKLYLYHDGKQVLDAEGKPVLATGEALKVQKDAAIAALPYLGQKLPMAVELTPPRRGVVVIGDLSAGDGQVDEFALPLPPIEQSQQNQQVIDVEGVRLDATQSHEDIKPMKQMGEFDDCQ